MQQKGTMDEQATWQAQCQQPHTKGVVVLAGGASSLTLIRRHSDAATHKHKTAWKEPL